MSIEASEFTRGWHGFKHFKNLVLSGSKESKMTCQGTGAGYINLPPEGIAQNSSLMITEPQKFNVLVDATLRDLYPNDEPADAGDARIFGMDDSIINAPVSSTI